MLNFICTKLYFLLSSSVLKAYKPYNTKQKVDQEAYDQHIKDLEPSLMKFEELYIQDEGFLFGNGEISIADLPGKLFSFM